MTDNERKAEIVIKEAYKNGGHITTDEILTKFDESFISEDIMSILDFYGKTGSDTLDATYGWNWYKLSEKGMEFTRNGCFSGEKHRGLLTLIGAAAAIIAAIAGIIGLFL